MAGDAGTHGGRQEAREDGGMTEAGFGSVGELIITDAMAEHLLRSLERMEADYEATLAAEERLRQAAEAPHSSLRDGSSGAEAAAASEESGGEEPPDGYAALDGYATLGSDDEGSEVGPGRAEHGQSHGSAAEEADVWDTYQRHEEAFGTSPWPSACSGPGSTWPSCEAPGATAGTAVEEEQFEDFQAAASLENFADFGASNPALPPPPPGVNQLQATLLTDEEVRSIKDTMKQISVTPPAWACNLPDQQLERMVRDLLRS